jgi:hypothetical protein
MPKGVRAAEKLGAVASMHERIKRVRPRQNPSPAERITALSRPGEGFFVSEGEWECSK